jgi:hypothetical protein
LKLAAVFGHDEFIHNFRARPRAAPLKLAAVFGHDEFIHNFRARPRAAPLKLDGLFCSAQRVSISARDPVEAQINF